MRKILLIGIIAIIFIGFNNNKNLHIKVLKEINKEVINIKKDILKVDLKPDIIKEYNSIQKDLIKLKNDMQQENYVIKKETITVKDTLNGVILKINYPLIYIFEDNNIEYFDNDSSDILNLIFEEIYDFIEYDIYNGITHSQDFFRNSLNSVLIANNKEAFDYKISYIDEDFLTIDYTNNLTCEIGGKSFISDLTANFWFKYDKNKHYELNLFLLNNEIKLDFILPNQDKSLGSVWLIDRKEVIEDEEILDFIKNGEFEELNNGKNLMKPFVEELNKTGKIPKNYSLTKEFLLKKYNQLVLIIDTPEDEICKIEIEYNWRDKLIKYYEEVFKGLK